MAELNQKEKRTLRHPPIQEMALSVALKCPPVNMDQVESFGVSLGDEFKRFARIETGAFTFNPKDQQMASIEENHCAGLRFRSVDGHQFVSLQNAPDRIVVFSYNLVPPYNSWEEFKRIALPSFEKAINHLKPAQLGRIGVRAVDRIRITPAMRTLEDVLVVAPRAIPGIAPGVMNGFLYRDELYYRELDLHATIVRVMQRPKSGAACAIVLDTDVFSIREIPTDMAAFGATLEKIHELQNSIFFGSVNEKVLEGCR